MSTRTEVILSAQFDSVRSSTRSPSLFTRTYNVQDLPAHAEWIVAQTDDGTVLSANVVRGWSWLEWPRELGGVTIASVQDGDFNEILSDVPLR